MKVKALLEKMRKSTTFSSTTDKNIDLFIERNTKDSLNNQELTKLVVGLIEMVIELKNQDYISNSIVDSISWAGATTSSAIIIPTTGNYSVLVFGSGQRDTNAGDITANVDIQVNAVSNQILGLTLGVALTQITMHLSLPPKSANGISMVTGDSLTFISAAGTSTTIDANDRFTAILIRES